MQTLGCMRQQIAVLVDGAALDRNTVPHRSDRVLEPRRTIDDEVRFSNAGLRSAWIARRCRGNFPQAFTHMGLISAAFNLDRRLGGAA
jgi:hypothetical protein